jgi:hypothetical protein
MKYEGPRPEFHFILLPSYFPPMFPQLALRILRTTDPRLLGKFMWNFGVKGTF